MIDPTTNTPYAAHEKDPRWKAVDDFATSQLHTPAAPFYDSLSFAAKLSQDEGLPDIAVSPLQGQFLQMQCRLIGAKHILEVGTLGGYSTIWMAASSPDVRITTIEYNERHAAVARKAIENAGLSDRVEILIGAGVDVLPRLREQVAAGSREKFDFSFCDADKQNNKTYLDHSIAMSRQGACIVVDNVVRRGGVADAELAKSDGRIQGSREVIEAAGRDDRIDATVMQTVGEKNYDGFMICRLR